MFLGLLYIHDARFRNLRLPRGEESAGRVAVGITFRHCELEDCAQVPSQMGDDASGKGRRLQREERLQGFEGEPGELGRTELSQQVMTDSALRSEERRVG